MKHLKYDNIKLLKKLTGDSNQSVDIILLDKLLQKLNLYKIFKNLIEENYISINTIENIKEDGQNIIFKLKFVNTATCDNIFIKLKDKFIKYKNTEYKVNIDRKDNKITLYFKEV